MQQNNCSAIKFMLFRGISCGRFAGAAPDCSKYLFKMIDYYFNTLYIGARVKYILNGMNIALLLQCE